MAVYQLKYSQEKDVKKGNIIDFSQYGIDDIPLRAEVGNILLFSENDHEGTRTYLDVNNADPAAVMSWPVESNSDGWHQATLLSVNEWNNAQNYVTGDVVYDELVNKFYKCITDNTNIATSNTIYWQEVSDFTTIQQGHTNLVVTDYQFTITSRSALCVANKFYDVISEDFTCNLTLDDAANPLNMIAMLEAAKSKELDNKPDQADQIIDAVAGCCPQNEAA